MKRELAILVVALTSGCGADADPAPLDLGQVQLEVGCNSDPSLCTRPTNGGGVYTAESGSITMGPKVFMITRFVNHPGGQTTISGRYYDRNADQYVITEDDRFSSVHYGTDPTNYTVVSIDETNTVPTWQLSPTRTVSGPDIQNLELAFTVKALNNVTVRFHFIGYKTPDSTSWATRAQLRYSWDGGAWSVYCRDAQNNEDPIIFEHVAVSALNADVGNAGVTMSCTWGAIAFARSWGYVYQGSSDVMARFESAMHMKRASYCGDESFYTFQGAKLQIWDNAGIHNDLYAAGAPHASDVEAVWGNTPNGFRALCYSPLKRRHPCAKYFTGNPQSDGYFNGHCADNTHIDPCMDVPLSYYGNAVMADLPDVIPDQNCP